VLGTRLSGRSAGGQIRHADSALARSGPSAGVAALAGKVLRRRKTPFERAMLMTHGNIGACLDYGAKRESEPCVGF